ncbi:MAG: hypothetical protein HKO66_15615 [Saprospiraceae bacterium]|nr:hypothetical protein [Saprospiraceae bacterium]NNL93669.1 hypothetical protein [Saprospiraceae bacterium]
MKTFYCSLLLLIAFSGFAQNKDLNPISWSFDSNQVGPDDYELIYKANFKSPWVVYSMYTGDDGPVPTSITYTSKNVNVIGDAKEKGKRVEKMDEMFGVNVIKYEADEVYVIKQKVKITDISKPVSGYVTFMTCNNEICLPPKDVPFSFTFKVNGLQSDDRKNATKKLKIKQF